MSLDADVEGQSMVAALPALEATPEEAVVEKNWHTHRMAVLQAAMNRLPERDKIIVKRRHLTDTPATLKELSAEMGISIERVRQLESRAMKRLKEYAN